MDLGNMSLRFLRLAVKDTTYRDVLESLGGSIRAAAASLESMPPEDDQDWQEAMVDEKCNLTEDLLGVAFVVCQTQISAVTSRALRARKIALGRSGGTFAAFGEFPRNVRDQSESLASPATAKKVEMLWAPANYFKHNEEWRERDWSKFPEGSQEAKTIRVIEQAGLSSGSTGNLRTAAEFLGNPEYARMAVFADIVDDWAQKVLVTVTTELGGS